MFFCWLYDEEFDTEALAMDMQMPQNTNFHCFDADIYQSITKLLDWSKAIIYPQTAPIGHNKTASNRRLKPAISSTTARVASIVHNRETAHSLTFAEHKSISSGIKPFLSGIILTPANGECLYSSLLLAYLRPVMHNQEPFNQRWPLCPRPTS